jgi:methylmalonyl-CoA mutase, N-terminal domain
LRRKKESQPHTDALGISIKSKPIYKPEDIHSLIYREDLGEPGHFPFTRGVHESMYRGKLWTMRQYAGYATADEANKRYRYLLSQGTTGLSIAFDLPTQLGLDSDDSRAEGEVGKAGVAISSVEDMRRLLQGIPLDQVTTSMTINATASTLLAMYAVAGEESGVPISKLSGTVQNDILKEYAARGTYIYPPAQSMRLVIDVFEYCTENMRKWNVISVSGYHMREAGATAVQEIGFTLANGIAYADAAIERGLRIDDFAGQISFFFNAHNNLFEEIAKFRAARRLWAKIMRNRFGAKRPDSMKLRFHTQTAGSTLTAQQPENNVVRVAYQALAAVLGGTQSLHTNSMDEALALPSERAARMALRTQQVLSDETFITATADPAGGSYYLEKLTNELEEQASDLIRRVDRLGGMIRAIEQGFVQKMIADSAYEYQKKIESGSAIVVGVNQFVEHEEKRVGILKVDEEVRRRQVERLSKLKNGRSPRKVSVALAGLEETAISEQNLMPAIINAVRLRVTTGEISRTLRRVFGEYQAPSF